jgi:hypothetical protein
MRRRTFIGFCGLAVFGTIGVRGPREIGAAAEVRLAISPGYGPPGTEFFISVTGLAPAGAYSIAIYRVADGLLTGDIPALADSSGTVVTTYDSTGDTPGRYQAVVIARQRGGQVIRGDFTVSGPSDASSRFFPETGFTVANSFLRYWETYGGLAINGYPLSPERREKLEDGREYTVQYFERVRMEYHPEYDPPNDVLLGQFGRRIHPADPPAEQIVGALYFPQTGHNLSDITADRRTVVNFGRFWDNNGGLRQFGYPISEIISERLEDGNTYLVQYFERARFEFHPEYAGTPAEVLLGQFGRRILAEVDAAR